MSWDRDSPNVDGTGPDRPPQDPQPTFSRGDWVVDINNPGRPGIFTGRTTIQGPFTLLEIEFGPGDRRYRPLDYLRPAGQTAAHDLASRLARGEFGKLADLRRLLTFEKLKGTLHEVIYSMEAAQIDFYPYQFKPVIKFINSPTERLVIADEVGLGKTIEAALIWIELQARKQARRLLVICPTHLLANKWRDELREKFVVDARIVRFSDLRQEMNELRKNGPSHPFALITTYSSIRPPRSEHRHLDDSPEDADELSPKTVLCQELRKWDLACDPFDLVVFDEAHHMRNAGTANFQLGESVSRNAGAVLCVTATPVNNTNNDLHSLLRLIDAEFFQTQATFDSLLAANRPAVQLANALARVPVDAASIEPAARALAESPFVGQSPLFKLLLDQLDRLDPKNVVQVAACQDIVDKLNILGGYVTRTRRVQVTERRPIRDPHVCEVTFEPMEMKLYRTVIEIVRRRCLQDGRAFHVFQVVGLQMRAASSLPVLAAELRSGRLGDVSDLLAESFEADFMESDEFEEFAEENWSEEKVRELQSYDYEANDSKFAELGKMLCGAISKEKVIIFSFYRGTLAYLERRLVAQGHTCVVIHGGIDYDERRRVVEEFNSDTGPRLLLSSEVGSEGIDLHHRCRVLVNYDMPWNPMRVEQRIGRIDRVGQKEARLAIVHFKIAGTIEERIYDRLHARLALFANSLGDLETVIGDVVRQLTIDLLSKDLTPEMEERLINAAEHVLEKKLRDIQRLEESGDSLVALSDYVQKKIDEDRGRGRFVQPGELESYIADFFEQNFRGSSLSWDTPATGCVHLRLSPDAHSSLADFIRDDRSLSARPFRQDELAITFRREVHAALDFQTRRKVQFVNHLSPLVRWMTAHYANRGHRFFNVSAARICDANLSPGTWCYRIERWQYRGLSTYEQLGYAVAPLVTASSLTVVDAESVVQRLLANGTEWDYRHVDRDQLMAAQAQLEQELKIRFDAGITRFDAENQNAVHIRRERVVSQFDRRLAQDRQRIASLKSSGRSDRMLALAEARLRAGERNRALRLQALERGGKLDVDKVEVAAGVFQVTGKTPL
jgi:superfamily II DNA or RNA helicase